MYTKKFDARVRVEHVFCVRDVKTVIVLTYSNVLDAATDCNLARILNNTLATRYSYRMV